MRKLSVHDMNTGKQARNLLEVNLSEAVRPWFKDLESDQVNRAIAALSNPAKRSNAARYLGIEVVPCA
ncbi:MAG: hypothetical protein Q4P71_04945 [Actinomycetaceae bacterium]|nr:hypothetical protein [Actinomycetaceae bacterium]